MTEEEVWTDERRAAVESALRSGRSQISIAREFGVRVATVCAIAAYLGFGMSQLRRAARRAAMAARVADGDTVKSVAEFYGVTGESVKNACREHNIVFPHASPGRPGGAQTERNEEIVRRLEAGETITVLAREFGVSRQLISAIAKSAGKPVRSIRRLAKEEKTDNR